MRLLRLLGLFVFLVILFLWDLKTGSVKLHFSDFYDFFISSKIDANYLIIKEFRLSRAVMALIAGMGLAVSGILLQTLFRNPLAGPYVFGVSAGAGLGVALVLLGYGLTSQISGISIAVAGIIGAMSVLMLVFVVAMRISDNLTILVTGFFTGSAISAVISVLQFLSPAAQLKRFVIWTMGSLDAVSGDNLLIISVVVFVSVVVSFFFSKYLDALYVGEDEAISLGVNIKKLRLAVLFVSGILTGVITAFAGPIAFLGIAVPHISRLLSPSLMHKSLIIYSALLGGIFLLIADILSHSFSGFVVPVNSITAFLGLPVIFYVIFARRKF